MSQAEKIVEALRVYAQERCDEWMEMQNHDAEDVCRGERNAARKAYNIALEILEGVR